MYGLNSSSSSKKLVISCFLKLEANKNKYSHLMGPVNDQKAFLLQAHVQIFCQFIVYEPKC